MKFHWWQAAVAGVLTVAIGGTAVYAGMSARTKPTTPGQSQVTAAVYTAPQEAAPAQAAQIPNQAPGEQKPADPASNPAPVAPAPTQAPAKPKVTPPPVQQAASRGLPPNNSQGAVAYDWWTQASKYWPRGTTATVIDVQTGISFKVLRTMGTNHADVEPVTTGDSAAIKRAWGGNFSWERRPVVVVYEGYRMAAGMTSMPEGSEQIANNGATGHMNLHFLNSRTHGSNRVDPDYQAAIKKAVGH